MSPLPGLRIDPLGSYNFTVSLIDSTNAATAIVGTVSQLVAGFSECSGLDTTLTVEEYRAGGENGAVLKFPTRVSAGNIRLRRGVALSDDLWNWLAAFARGKGKRRDGTITLQNDLHIPLKTWAFTRALPIKWTGPTLDAAQNRVAIEELELAPERLELVTASSALAEATGVSI